jgi:hypothetical protein
MDAIYRGFDGLDVSFAAQISHGFCRALETAKEEAQRTHNQAFLEWNGVPMLVSESGARGGYAFLVSTGTFGGTWFFKRPSPKDPWGVRVSCGSFQLALEGLGRTRTDLNRLLNQLGVSVRAAGESIGRVDYAIDFLAPGFELVPDQFVMHSNANRADHVEPLATTINGRSGRVSSVTVGKMPGRQIIVYDKRAEVIAKRKLGWWEIWDRALQSKNLPPLDRENAAQSTIWRVELRAGKHHLKERWGVRTWSDLDARFGDMMMTMADAIRYTQPGRDTNRSRRPNSRLWENVREEISSDLLEMRSFAEPDLIKRVQREAHNQLLARQMIGLLTTRAGICGVPSDGLANFAILAGIEMGTEIEDRKEAFERKLARVCDRYSVLYR